MAIGKHTIFSKKVVQASVVFAVFICLILPSTAMIMNVDFSNINDAWIDNSGVEKNAYIIVPDDYEHIQDAIDAANDGDTIFIKNGDYELENGVVNSNVSIIGESRDGVIVDGWGFHHVFNIPKARDSVILSNITVIEATVPVTVSGSNCEISNLNVHSVYEAGMFPGSGISVGGSGNKVLDCYIHDTHGNNGISIHGNDNLVMNCYFGNFYEGTCIEANSDLPASIVALNTFDIAPDTKTKAIKSGMTGEKEVIIYGNNIYNCDAKGKFIWDNGEYVGNYWSIYDEPSEGAYDIDCDGRADEGHNKDNYSLMNPVDEYPFAFFHWVDNGDGTISFNANYSFDLMNEEGDMGSIVSYSWDFGDTNTGSGMIITHDYNTMIADDVYDVILTVEDVDGNIDEITRKVVLNDQSAPVYNDVMAMGTEPWSQVEYEPINITCDVTDLTGVDTVTLHIKEPQYGGITDDLMQMHPSGYYYYHYENPDQYLSTDYEFWFTVNDTKGNSFTTSAGDYYDFEIRLDDMKPTSKISYATGWFGGDKLFWKKYTNFEINGVSDDIGIGLDFIDLYYCYSADNITWTDFSYITTDTDPYNPSPPLFDPINFPFTATHGDGYYAFKSVATDLRGNEEEKDMTKYIKHVDGRRGVDTTDPIVSATVDPPVPNGKDNWYINPVTFTMTGSDDLSGLLKLEYKINDDDYHKYSEPISFKHKTVEDITIYYRAKDIAGNTAPAQQTFSFKVDSVRPTTTCNIDPGFYDKDINEVFLVSNDGPAEPGPSHGTGNGSVYGYVTYAINGTPIYNATVKLVDDDKNEFTTNTDINGYYEFYNNTPGGFYKPSASKENDFYLGAANFDLNENMQYWLNFTIGEKDGKSKIKGYIYDMNTMNGISDATVRIYDQTSDYKDMVKTNIKGYFEFKKLTIGTYDIKAYKTYNNGGFTEEYIYDIVVPANNTEVECDNLYIDLGGGSGVDKVMWKDETMAMFEEYNGEEIQFTSAGVHKLSYYAVDNAGGMEEIQEDVFVIDKEAPTDLIIESPSNNSLYLFGMKIPFIQPATTTCIGGPIKFTVKANDDYMVDRVEFIVGAFMETDYNDGNQDDTWSCTLSGYYLGDQKLSVRVYDKAGNMVVEDRDIKAFCLGLI